MSGSGEGGSVDAVHAREAEFHDRLAESLDPGAMPPGPPDRFEQMLFRSMGDIRGLRVLELGCGDGGITLQLLRAGAEVVAIDISPKMVEVAAKRAEHFFPDGSADVRVGEVEATGLPDSSVDMVVGKWILHHVGIRESGEEIRRVLRPGGVGVFFENHFRNPLLALGRTRMVGRYGIPRFGTEDEHPLTDEDYDIWRSMFSRVDLEYPDFHFFELLNRQLFNYRHSRLTKLTIGLDQRIARSARLRPYSYHVIVKLTK